MKVKGKLEMQNSTHIVKKPENPAYGGTRISSIDRLRAAGRMTPADEIALGKLFADAWDRAPPKARDLLEPQLRDQARRIMGRQRLKDG